MINSNELRIGNYVKLFDTNDCYKIHLVSKKSVQIESGLIGGEVFKLDNLHPIPLTEEILLKCGFELIKGWYVKGKIELFNINNNYFTTPSKGIISVDIIYLHQLQNLYFALTGQELQVNL